LRERREDIMLLTELFLERTAARHGLAVPRIAPRALAALSDHPWPGNVRELANVIEAAVLLSTGEIDVEHLPGIGLGNAESASTDSDSIADAVLRVLAPYARTDGPVPPALKDARDAFERAYLDLVLHRTSGNVAHAAKMAGRNRTDFYDLLRRHQRSPAAYKRTS
jgi:two-component system response regulator GlrR